MESNHNGLGENIDEELLQEPLFEIVRACVL